MSADLSTVVSVVSGVLGILVSGYVALLRYAITQRDTIIDRQFSELKAELKAQTEQTSARTSALKDQHYEDAIKTQKITGEIELLKSKHDSLTTDVEEIKDKMVTRTEFQQGISEVKNLLRTYTDAVLSKAGRYSSTSQSEPGMPSPTSPRR